MTYLDRIEDVLDGLPSDSSAHDAYDALSDFEGSDVQAVLANRSLSGGGATPGVGDYVVADINNGPTVTNNGSAAHITFDDGVIAGGAGTVTLNADQQHIDVAAAGVYAVTAHLLFDGSDPTGVRGVSVGAGGGGLGSVVTEVPGAPINGSDTHITVTAVLALPASDQITVDAYVKGAAGDVGVNYGLVSVVKVAGLGA